MSFEKYVDRAGEYRWRLKASNGNIIADCGEGYVNAVDRDHAIDLVKSTSAATPVE